MRWGHGTPSHPKKLTKYNCVIDSSIHQPRRWRYFDSNKERHINVDGSIEVNDGNIAAEFSAKGHGIAFLPNFLVRAYLKNGELVSILDVFQIPPVPVSLVYPANRIKSPALNGLVSYLLESRP